MRSLTLNWVTFCIETSNKAVVLKLHKEYVPICMEVSELYAASLDLDLVLLISSMYFYPYNYHSTLLESVVNTLLVFPPHWYYHYTVHGKTSFQSMNFSWSFFLNITIPLLLLWIDSPSYNLLIFVMTSVFNCDCTTLCIFVSGLRSTP